MKHECIQLIKHFPTLARYSEEAAVHTYIQDVYPEMDEARLWPAVVICPGGGYEFTSNREAEPVALKFLHEGYQVFVLRYSVKNYAYPTQVLELSATLSMIRNKSDVWHVNPDKIAICGFSAGGHICASLSNFWSEPFISETLQIKQNQNKPNAAILCYPVISSGEHAHRGSFEIIIGNNLSETEKDKLSLEKSVNAKNPPTFLWHTVNDTVVPVQNAMLYSQSLIENKIPFEMHLYPHGVHGLALASEATAKKNESAHIKPNVSAWFSLALTWLKEVL